MYLSEDMSALKVTEGGPDASNWIYADVVMQLFIEQLLS